MSMKIFANVWHANLPYSGLGALGVWARRSRHGVAVRSVPGGNKTNRTIPQLGKIGHSKGLESSIFALLKTGFQPYKSQIHPGFHPNSEFLTARYQHSGTCMVRKLP
jgi:hypothetical protein